MTRQTISLADQHTLLVRRIIDHQGTAQIRDAIIDHTGHGLATYVEGYRLRMRECLRDDFPLLLACLGDARFDRIADAVIAADPGDERTLNRWSRRLPSWLEQHPRRVAAWGRELAHLEWALIEAIRAPLPATPRPPLIPDNPGHLRLEASPALRLLPSRFATETCWHKHRTDQAVHPPQRRSTPALLAISRTRAEGLRIDTLNTTHGELLNRLARGRTLAAAVRGLPISADDIGPACQTWIGRGLLLWPERGDETSLRKLPRTLD